jgi:predicted regulator of Ras-like GTPase activity (Roadblock/LC7/MglB family)
MALKGNLHDMAIADLIQHQCTDRKTARVIVQSNNQTADLYFKDGEMVHACLGENEGEEVVFTVLRWEEGTFSVESAVEAPKVSINRGWSGLLMEGAKLIDEEAYENKKGKTNQGEKPEVKNMTTKLDDMLLEMSTEMNGFFAGSVTGMDGINVAQMTKGKVNPESVSAQFAILVKLITGSAEKAGMGLLEDILIQTEEYYLMSIVLPGNNQYFLTTVVDRKTGNIGNLRMVSKIYADRLSMVMPTSK